MFLVKQGVKKWVKNDPKIGPPLRVLPPENSPEKREFFDLNTRNQILGSEK